MKNFIAKIILLLVLFFSFNTSFSQYTKYLVKFSDKNNSLYQFNKPLKYLSQKAINRRTRYNISLDSSDLPVNPSYISQVLAQGSVSYLSQSKWLNQILIYTTDTSAIAIEKLSFVKKVEAVAPASTTTKTIQNKFKETVSAVNAKVSSAKATANKYNYGSSYNQVHIHNGEFLHNKGLTGKNIIIAIIDAGFYHYKTITAFDSARAHQQFLGEKDFVDFDNSVDEDDSHGEYCLSIIAADVPGKMVGTAPDAKFWLLRSENVNSEYPIEEHNWAAAAEFADSAGADMISSSLGYNQFDDSQFDHTYSDFYKNRTMVSRAASLAAKKGMIVTNSAGNEGNNSWKYIIFPADDVRICAVGATDILGNIASFSSYGYPGKVKPNIASVGLNTIIYTSGGVSTGSGTSFSNPNINGLIACLWQAFREFDNTTILDAVYKSADRYQTPDNRYGFGIPNMQKAYNILKQKENSNLYGDEWLLTSSTNFTNSINVKLVASTDGYVAVNLLNADKKIVAVRKLITEKNEVYDFTLDDLNKLQSGVYTLQYKDQSITKTILIKKD
ncbi:MAG TPA: S8 family serine peptidase [Parafilimonas sp.]